MDKKLTVIEAAKLLGVSKEAIYNRLRRGSLQSVVEDGIKYILLTKGAIKEGPTVRHAESGVMQGAYVELLRAQLEEMKQKNEKLEADKERLIADKERLLIESKEKIEMIYKERDEQLKAILTLANRQITHTGSEAASSATDAPSAPVKKSANTPFIFEEADVLDEEDEEQGDEEIFEAYSDWRDLRSYLKEKGFSKKEKQHISDKLGKKVGQLDNVMDKNGKLFIKKGKKLKEILGE